MNPRFETAEGILGRLCSSIAAGVPRRCFTATPGLADVIPLRPGELSILGGAPGSGKTLLAVCLVVDALRANPGLRALVANVEMPAERLLARQLARLSGLELDRIEAREPGITDSPQFAAAVATLEAIGERLAFLQPPFTAGTLEAAGMKFEPELVLVDYVQRFTAGPETGGRENIDGMISFLRSLCTEAGCAVLAVAAIHRGKDSRGASTYGSGIGLASFRGSSEMEYGADNAFTLATNKRGKALLACCKARYGKMESARLLFDFPGHRSPSRVVRMKRFSRMRPNGSAMKPKGATMNEAAPGIIPLGQEPRPQAIPREAPPKPKPRRGKSNRFEPLNHFVGGPLAKVKGRAAVAVWIVLFARTNRKTGLARISQGKLAELCGCTARAVRTALNELQAAGLLQVRFRGGEFAGTSIYRLAHGKEPAL